ncbi:hypothetical protein WH47_04891 [Habropoda laboriosa]|uniref:Uncharacterized protein n=1 Tax=Habropoda laboriosa TaxID=597456 RepID=A0A0L7QVV5_9HYME|nr:hypothetical protein WH47_04891 [Habropoda laboriosa]
MQVFHLELKLKVPNPDSNKNSNLTFSIAFQLSETELRKSFGKIQGLQHSPSFLTPTLLVITIIHRHSSPRIHHRSSHQHCP